MWSIKTEFCFSVFGLDSGDSKQTGPRGSEGLVWTIHNGAADQKCVLAPNHSALHEPTVAFQWNKDLKKKNGVM